MSKKSEGSSACPQGSTVKMNNFVRDDSKASDALGVEGEASLNSNINVALYNSLTAKQTGKPHEQIVKYENYDSSGGTKDDEAVSGANSSAAPARKGNS